MAIKVRWKFTCSVFICIFSACFLKLVNGINLDDRSPSRDFTEHAITKPRIYHGRSKRELSNTLDEYELGGHTRDLVVSLQLNGVERILDLTINHDLIGSTYFEKTQKNGSYHIHRPTIDELELCHYRGVIRNVTNSWAAVSTCSGLKGVIYDGKNTYYIDEGPEHGINYVYDGRHLRTDKNQSCGFPQTPLVHRIKRETDTIRGPYNANRQSRYVELLLVVDNEEYKELKTLPKVYQHCKDIANIINALFVPLNIFIALIGVVVWTEHDEISLTPNGDTTLTHFLHYRREILVKEHPNDNAQLLTRVKFDGGVVGKALKGPICTFEFSGGVSMDHSNVVGLVATTVAHELGHNFGMEHDNAECQCPDDRCIMAPSSSATSPSHWSSCSLEYLALAFEHGMDYCLRNKPEKLFDSPVCGNGFVEPGEQCDCGLPHRCDNPCCNATSCMLLSNASCATGQCCDFQTCKPKNAGTVCRSAEHECDLPEFCTGESEYCPEDVYKIDGESCSKGKAFCYGGKCRTHSDQCQLLWGPSGKNSDIQCYDMNTKGSRHGNCGYNRLNQTYIKCYNENVYCGMVHCSHLNERLEFGMESVSILSHSFINSGGAIIACRTALVDLGLNEVDPGLAPDGAKCGDGKMCVNQKCMSVDALRKMSPDSCPQDCNGNGVCNSKGHCHCEHGYAPPLCNYPGHGGSSDSGPASDPNTAKEVTTALYLIFFGVIPLMLLFSFLVYYARHSVKIWWKTSPARPNNTLWKTKRQSPSGGTSVLLPDSSSVSVGIVDVGIVRQGSPGPKATLLPDDSPRIQVSKPAAPPLELQNDLFGHFKGFSITPLKKPDDYTQISNLKSPELNHENSSSLMTPSNSVKYEKVDNTLKNNSIILSASNGVKQTNIRTQNSWRNDEGRLRVISPPTLPAVTFRTPKTKPKPVVSDVKHTEDVVDSVVVVPSRPEISEPVLEGTTAKDLISEGTALVPSRKAPEIPKMEVPNSIAPQIPTEKYPKEPPPLPKSRPLSSPVELTEENKILKDLKENKEYPTLTKIASIMRNASVRRSSSISEKNGKKKPEVKKLKIDKEKLKNIEISNPIPQVDAEDGDDNNKKEVTISRAQSMRETTQPKPNLQSFGSMRVVNAPKRPTSIHVPNRPTSPPPRPPPIKNPDYSYDDCLNLLSEKTAPLAHIDEENSPSADNIYAVIEESPKAQRKLENERKVHFSDEKYEIPKSLEFPVASPKPALEAPSSGSTESMGLLGEIVSEIQARNLESIYSSGTLKKKKEAKDSENYENNTNIYTAKSDISSSSSSTNGYLNPKKINSPVNLDFNNSKNTNEPKSYIYNDFNNKKPNVEEPPKKNNLEATYKPYSSSLIRNSGPLSYSYKEKTDVKLSTPPLAAAPAPETPPKPEISSPQPAATVPSVNTTTPSSASPYVKSSFTRPSLLSTPTPPKFTPQSIISSIKKPEAEEEVKKPTPPKNIPNLPTSGNVKRTLSGGKGAIGIVATANSNLTAKPPPLKTVKNPPIVNRTAPSPPRKNSVGDKENEAQKPPTRPLPSPPRKTEPKPVKSDNSVVSRPLPAVPRKNSKENLAKVNSVSKKPAVSEKKPEIGKPLPRKNSNSNVASLQSKFDGSNGANLIDKKKPIPPSVASKPNLNVETKQ